MDLSIDMLIWFGICISTNIVIFQIIKCIIREYIDIKCKYKDEYDVVRQINTGIWIAIIAIMLLFLGFTITL